MAVSRSLRRLLDVYSIQEEQARRATAEAAAETRRLRGALGQARARERAGRRLVVASAHSGAVADRLAGVEEARIARRVATMLAPRIAAAEREEELRRQEFLARRIERRQAETLLEAAEQSVAREESRRAQQMTDDLHLRRLAQVPEGCERRGTAGAPVHSTSDGESSACSRM